MFLVIGADCCRFYPFVSNQVHANLRTPPPPQSPECKPANDIYPRVAKKERAAADPKDNKQSFSDNKVNNNCTSSSRESYPRRRPGSSEK